eukprot:6179321-Alexandrium_andersonii.AAC.1
MTPGILHQGGRCPARVPPRVTVRTGHGSIASVRVAPPAGTTATCTPSTTTSSATSSGATRTTAP